MAEAKHAKTHPYKCRKLHAITHYALASGIAPLPSLLLPLHSLQCHSMQHKVSEGLSGPSSRIWAFTAFGECPVYVCAVQLMSSYAPKKGYERQTIVNVI